MANPAIFVGNINTKFLVFLKDQDEAVVDLTDTTSRVFLFEKPDKTIWEQTATFETDGSEGGLKYLSTSGFLDLPGQWQLQPKVIFTDGSTFYGDIEQFEVQQHLR